MAEGERLHRLLWEMVRFVDHEKAFVRTGQDAPAAHREIGE
jgi:hypothetical protein